MSPAKGSAMPRLFLVCVMLLFPAPALAQNMQCAPRDAVLSMLAKQEQTRRAMGLAGRAVMELFAHADGSLWTLTITLPDGRTCLLANGSDFSARDEAFPASGTRL